MSLTVPTIGISNISANDSSVSIIGTQSNYYSARATPDFDYQLRDITSWLSPLNFNASQNEFIQKPIKGTGQWFLESQAFKDWRDGTSGMLWCPGDAGAGKTILASIVVDHLQTLFEEHDIVATAFIYCSYKEHAEQMVATLIASLLKQIVQGRGAITDHVQSFYERHQRRETRPTLSQLIGVLISEIQTYSKVFIVVDALDECREDDATRAMLLEALRSLPGQVNLLVTSRDLPSIARDFEGTKRLYIRAKDDDIRAYIEGRIAFGPRRLKVLQKVIVDKIVENAKGMFLMARLHMDSLMGKLNARAVRTALDNLPEGMDDTYDEAMERVKRQDDSCKELAKQVLSWITYVVRPLSVKELQHALAVVPNTTSIDPDGITDDETLTSVCQGLIVIDEKRNVIGLVHYTAQEYFERKGDSQLPNAQASITTTCLTYLSFDVFGTGRCDDYDSLLSNNPFLDYAARHWGDHIHGQEEAMEYLALDFLQDSSKAACAGDVSMVQCWERPVNYSGMHLSAFFGLAKIVEYQLKNGAMADMKGMDGKSPLSIAAQNGHEAVVRLLLAREEVDLNSKDKRYDRTPLSWAAGNGHEAVVKLLLTRGEVDINSKDQRHGQTPLGWAAENGHEAVVKLLLARHGVNPNSKGQRYGRTPLLWAAGNGHEAVVKLLLAHADIDVNSKDWHGWTAVSRAARKGHESVMKLLLARDDVDVNCRDSDGRTPFSLAAGNGHEAMVELLLMRGDVDVNSKDQRYGQTPFAFAAESGHESVVRLLLMRDDVDVNWKDLDGRTPFSRAARNGHEATVKLLLTRDDVDVHSKDQRYGQTPLSFAAENGHESVVGLLLARNDVDVNCKDSDGRTPLSRAAGNGREAIVKLLLAQHDVDVNSKDERYGQTPFSFAAENGRVSVVKLLLARHDVDVDCKDSDGRMPLSWAAGNGHHSVVGLLLARDDVNVNCKDSRGRTPLSWAAGNGHEVTVGLLLARDDIDVNSKDQWYGQTPLSWAAEHGHEAAVKILLARDDVDVNSKDLRYGRTPLSWAAESGHEAVVKLLLAQDDVDANQKDADGRTPLSWAAENGHEAIVKLLVCVDSKDCHYGSTPLLCPAQNGHGAG